ncbi:MAG: hypothetical protein LBC63_05830 [Holophagales bacterium]|nr:hypothetical protein [Holophagales bacterium]
MVFAVKYADPYEIAGILEKFRTKSLEGTILEAFETSSAKGIIARDTSLVLATITRAVAALDVPTAVSGDEPGEENQFDLRFDVIWASNSKNPVGDEIPAFLKDTASTIVKTLNYRFLAHGGTFMQTVSDNGKAYGGGTITRPHKDIHFGTYGQNFTWELKTSNKYNDYISGLFSAQYAGGQISNAKIELKPGQKVVIGTTMIGEGIAMIVVISVSKPE